MTKQRIAYLGPKGTVSEESTFYFFQESNYELVPYKIISEVFHATVSGETALSVIPIENTIEGSVSLHMDMLVHDVQLPIQAEWVYPSRQNLIGRNSKGKERDEMLASVRKVLSHPVAIAQCKKFLNKHLAHAEIEHVSSTAEGVRSVSAQDDDEVVAIGTSLAAERYGLDKLVSEIQDHSNNYTKFIAVGPERLPYPKSTDQIKTSVLVTLPEDYPGALHQVLSAFAWRRINLSRIESRPTKKQLGLYYFIMDIEASLDSVLLPGAIAEIEAIGCQVRVLGCYPSYHYGTQDPH